MTVFFIKLTSSCYPQFADCEMDVMRYYLEKSRPGTLFPECPEIETELFKEKEEKRRKAHKAKRDHKRVVKSVEVLVLSYLLTLFAPGGGGAKKAPPPPRPFRE